MVSWWWARLRILENSFSILFQDDIRVRRLSPKAYLPTRASPQSAGLDLYATEDHVIQARDMIVISTELQVKVPPGTYGRIASRSGMTLDHVTVEGGVVDADYRGPLKVILYNHSASEYVIREGTRIAQLICQKIIYPRLREVSEMEDTARGSSGFGSSENPYQSLK